MCFIKSTLNKFCIAIAFLSGICYNLNGQIINIESQRIITDSTGMSGDIGLSLAASKNAKSYVAFNGHGHLQYKNHNDLWLFIMDYDLVNAGNENFSDSWFGHIRYNRKIGEVIRPEAFIQAQFNEISKIDLRILNGIGIRLKLSDLERAKFYYGITYMYEYEEVSDLAKINKDHRLSSYFTFTLKPEKTVLLRNTTYIQPLIKEFEDFRLSNDTRLIFSITKQLKFTTTFSFLYDSRPPIGVPNSIYQINNGLNFQF
jgi:hypothetical protein